LKNCRLQKRGTGGETTTSTDGTFDISNWDRVGKTEVELVQLVIDGVELLIKMEKRLEKGGRSHIKTLWLTELTKVILNFVKNLLIILYSIFYYIIFYILFCNYYRGEH